MRVPDEQHDRAADQRVDQPCFRVDHADEQATGREQQPGAGLAGALAAMMAVLFVAALRAKPLFAVLPSPLVAGRRPGQPAGEGRNRARDPPAAVNGRACGRPRSRDYPG
jgi:hypothetical protein